MAYILVTKERPKGHAQLCERVGSADFTADHFRTCLSDRIAWAVEDAEREVPALEPEPVAEPETIAAPEPVAEHEPVDEPEPVDVAPVHFLAHA